MKEAVSAFKYAHPTKINELKPTSNDIDNLRVLLLQVHSHSCQLDFSKLECMYTKETPLNYTRWKF